MATSPRTGMVEGVIEVLVAVLGLVVIGVASATRVIKPFERGVVFRLGRVRPILREPGVTMIVPVLDRLQKVDTRLITVPAPAQDTTRDGVAMRVDAVVSCRVVDPARAITEVPDYRLAIGQLAQTSLRSIIASSDVEDLRSDHEPLRPRLEATIGGAALGWGINIEQVEIKEVAPLG